MLFFFFILVSMLMALSTNSWFVSWVALEFNMMAFIPMMLKKKNKYSSESTLKYFIMQTVSSILIIVPAITMILMDNIMVSLITAALSIKLGAAPFHQWVPAVVEGLTWQNLMILLSLQKVNPLILMNFTTTSWNLNLGLTLILASSIIGSIGGLAQTSLRKIMAYSSITHMAWMLTSIYTMSCLWICYLAIYSVIIMSVMVTLCSYQVFSLNHILMIKKNYMTFSISLLSLGGLPPLTGFAMKLMVILQLMHTNCTFIMLPLLSATFVSLFFYMRMLLINTLILSYKQTNTHYKQTKTYLIINFLNLSGLLVPTLSLLTW